MSQEDYAGLHKLRYIILAVGILQLHTYCSQPYNTHLDANSISIRPIQHISTTKIESLNTITYGPTWWITDSPISISEFEIKSHAITENHSPVWKPVKVPAELLSQGVVKKQEDVVYLKTFRIASIPDFDLAIRLGEINCSDRTFLNGELVGQNGILGAKTIHSYDVHRVYRLPRRLLKVGTNTILIKVKGHPFEFGDMGIFRNRTEIGPATALLKTFYFENFANLMLLSAYLTAGLFFIFLYIRQQKTRENLLFGLVVISLVLYSFLRNQLKYELPFSFVTLKRAEYSILFISPVLLYFFIFYYFRIRMNKWQFVLHGIVKASTVAPILGVLAALLGVNVFLLDDLNLWVMRWHMVLIAFGGFSIVFTKVIQGNIDAKIMLAGLLILLIATAHDQLVNMSLFNNPRMTSYATGALLLSLTVVLANRFVRVHKESERLNKELESQNKSLETLHKLKDDFLANTSHELRTPLTGIVTMAESALDDSRSPKTPDLRRELQFIAFQGKRLSNLINDVLDYSRLRHNDIHLSRKSIDLRQITEVVLALSRPLVANKSLDLRNNVSPSMPPAYADENRLQQILFNLVGNAIKFTQDGEISVSAALDKDVIIISVSDTGIGIRPEDQQKIFESFEQVEPSLTREFGGTGLGLSVTKRLVEMHGGKITVESKPGIGSIFSFGLAVSNEAPEDIFNIHRVQNIGKQEPFNSNNSQTFTSANSRPNENSDHCILVVDDEPSNREVLLNLLHAKGYEATAAHDGMQALQNIEKRIPDLILLDVMMPRLNGFDVCKTLRKQYTLSELPIIMLTAKDQVKDLLAGLDSGANDYLAKPFSRDELLARINVQLTLSKIHESYARFVPSEFLQHLDKDSIMDVKLGDQIQREMTIFFSDLRNFSTLSETMSPRENFDFLNAIFRRVGPIVREHKGFIDKFIGDAIMAIFPRNPSDAVNSALKMQSMLQEYNTQRLIHNYAPISAGFGIHVGTIMLGTIGENQRMDSTVISDAVNLTSRLEGLCKQYGASIVVSEETLNRLEPSVTYSHRFLDRVKVKGKKKAVSIFEIIDEQNPSILNLKKVTKADFEKGVKLYHSGNFTQAAVRFENVLQQDPNDAAASLYLKRAAHFMVNKPLPDWDSSTAMDSK